MLLHSRQKDRSRSIAVIIPRRVIQVPCLNDGTHPKRATDGVAARKQQITVTVTARNAFILSQPLSKLSFLSQGESIFSGSAGIMLFSLSLSAAAL